MSTNLLHAWSEHQTTINNRTTSDKGDAAYVSTLSPCLDLYSAAGALRGRNDAFFDYFTKAYESDPLISLALLLRLRDARQGQGERDLFRDGLKYIETKLGTNIKELIHLIVHYGRVDDLFHFESKEVNKLVAEWFCDIMAYGYRLPSGKLFYKNFESDPEVFTFYKGLAAKWLPRKPKTKQEKYIVATIIKKLGITRKEYRLWCSLHSKTVEQKMSNKNWHLIDYNQVPSRAANIYRYAFNRNDNTRYQEYLAKLTKGSTDVKVNAGAVYPYDIMCCSKTWDVTETTPLLQAQWDSLPNYVADSKVRILPMIDVSGSMNVLAGRSNVTCMDVAIGLGCYITERQESPFRGMYLTFSETPSMGTVLDQDGNVLPIVDKYRKLRNEDWGGSTAFDKAFRTILEVGEKSNLAADDYPEVLLVLSDMNFDQSHWGDRVDFATASDRINAAFQEKGIKPPKIVFWNLYHNGTFTCTINQYGVCEISGFSPSVVKDVLRDIDNLTPGSVMLNGIEQYLETLMLEAPTIVSALKSNNPVKLTRLV